MITQKRALMRDMAVLQSCARKLERGALYQAAQRRKIATATIWWYAGAAPSIGATDSEAPVCPLATDRHPNEPISPDSHLPRPSQPRFDTSLPPGAPMLSPTMMMIRPIPCPFQRSLLQAWPLPQRPLARCGNSSTANVADRRPLTKQAGEARDSAMAARCTMTALLLFIPRRRGTTTPGGCYSTPSAHNKRADATIHHTV
nr:hypothetical protein CFP56_38778 [Quercus suber]